MEPADGVVGEEVENEWALRKRRREVGWAPMRGEWRMGDLRETGKWRLDGPQ
jgi:hypothetical protein